MESKILIKSRFIIKFLLKLKNNRTYVKYNSFIKKNTYSFVKNSNTSKIKKTIKKSSKSMKSIALLWKKSISSYFKRRLGVDEDEKEFKENEEKMEENNTKLENTNLVITDTEQNADKFALNKKNESNIDENNEEEYENSYSDEDEQQNTTTDDDNESEDEQQQNMTIEDDLEDDGNENDDNEEKIIDVGKKLREQLEILKSGKRSVSLLGDIKSRRTSVYLSDNNRNNEESDDTKISSCSTLLEDEKKCEKKSNCDSRDSGYSPESLSKESHCSNEEYKTQETINKNENYEKEIEKSIDDDTVMKNCQMNSEENNEWFNNDDEDDVEMESLILSDSENENCDDDVSRNVENVEKDECNISTQNTSTIEEIEYSSSIVNDGTEKITNNNVEDMIVNNTVNDDFRPSHIDAIVGKVIGNRSLNLDETSHNKSIINTLYSKITVNKGNECISMAKTNKCSSPQPSTSKAALNEYPERSFYEENKNAYSSGSISSEESSTSEFLGFSESELQLPSLPGMLPTPIVMKKSSTIASSVFFSEDLEKFLRENDLESSATHDLWSSTTQYNENGLVLYNTKPPLLLPNPIGDASKPRTLAAKRQQLEKNSEMYTVEIENSIYYQLKKRMKNEPLDQNVINSIQDSATPLRRDYWKILSWLNTPIGKYYYQKIKIDNKEFILFGSKGNHDEYYLLSCTSSKVIHCDNEKTRYCSKNCKQNINLNNIQICNDFHSNKNNEEYKKILNKIENNNFIEDIENEIEIKNQCNNNRPGPLKSKCLRVSSNPNLGLTEIYNMPTVQLEVYPKINRPLDDAVKPYLKLVLPSDNISNEWAKFSVSTLVTTNQQNHSKNGNNNEENEKNRNYFIFDIPYTNNQNKLLVRRIYNLNTNVEDIQDDNENLNKLNFYKDIDKNDQISVDCGNILTEMINSVVLSISGDLLIKNDPDINYNENDEKKLILLTSNDTSSNIKNVRKDRRKSRKLQLELKRLNATIIDTKDLQGEPNCEYKKCNSEFCRLGCICDSLNYQSYQTHCKEENCMLECCCKDYSNTCSNTNPTITKHDALILRKKATAKLAKVEKEFTQTILITPEETLLLNDTSNERKRLRKIPRRWGDYISDGVLVENQIQVNEKAQNNNESVKTQVNDNQLPLKTADQLINTELQNDNKSNILKSLKHLNVELNKLDLNDIEPWCMTHSVYKCHCYNKIDDTFIDNENQNVSVNEENKALRKQKHSPLSSINKNNSNLKPDEKNYEEKSDGSGKGVEEKQQKLSIKNVFKQKPGRPRKYFELKQKNVKDRIRNSNKNNDLQMNRIFLNRERHDKLRYTKLQPDTCSRLREIPSVSFRNANRRRAEAVKREIQMNENDCKRQILHNHIRNNLLIESKNKKPQEKSDVLRSEENYTEELSNVQTAKQTTTSETSLPTISPHPPPFPPPPPPEIIDLTQQLESSTTNDNSNPKLPIISSVISLTNTHKTAIANQVYCHFISKLNEFVSKRMHTICESQRLKTTDLPEPEPNRTLDLHITSLIDAYKANTIQVWQCKIDDHTFYTITKKSMPLIEHALSVVNIKTLSNNNLPFLCKLLKSDDNIKIPDNILLFVLLIGFQQYWLIKGFNLASENSLEKGRIFKPTPQTHPWLSPKISELYQHLFSSKILPENINQSQQQCTQKNAPQLDSTKQKIIQHQKNIQFSEKINPEQRLSQSSTSSKDNSVNVAKAVTMNNVVEDIVTNTAVKLHFKTNLIVRKLTQKEAERIGSIVQKLVQYNDTYWLTIEAVKDFSHMYISLCEKFLSYDDIENSLQKSNNCNKILSFNLCDDINLLAVKKVNNNENNSHGTSNAKTDNTFYLFIGPFKTNDNKINNLQIMLFKSYNDKMMLREHYEKYHNIKREKNTNAFWLHVNNNNKIMYDLDMRSLKILGQDNNLNTINNADDVNNTPRSNSSKDFDDDCYIIDDNNDNSKNDSINYNQSHIEITRNHNENLIMNTMDVSKQKSPLKIASVSSLNASQYSLQQQRNVLATESNKIYAIKRKNPAESVEIPSKKNCYSITTSLPSTEITQIHTPVSLKNNERIKIIKQRQQQQSLLLSSNSKTSSSPKTNPIRLTPPSDVTPSTSTSKLICVPHVNSNPIANSVSSCNTSTNANTSGTGNNNVRINPSIIKQINLIKSGAEERNQSNQNIHNTATAIMPNVIAMPIIPLTTNSNHSSSDDQTSIDSAMMETSASCSVEKEQQQQPQTQHFFQTFRNFVSKEKRKQGTFPKSLSSINVKSVNNTTKTQKVSTLSYTTDDGNTTAGTVVTTSLTTSTMIVSNSKDNNSNNNELSLVKRPIRKSLKKMLPSSFVLLKPSTSKQNITNNSDSTTVSTKTRTSSNENKLIDVNNEAKTELLKPSTSLLVQHQQHQQQNNCQQQKQETNTVDRDQSTTSGVKLSKLSAKELERLKYEKFEPGHFVSDYCKIKFPTKLYDCCFLVKSPDNKILKLDRDRKNASLHITSYMKNMVKVPIPENVTDMNWRFVPCDLTKAQKHNPTVTTTTTTRSNVIQQLTELEKLVQNSSCKGISNNKEAESSLSSHNENNFTKNVITNFTTNNTSLNSNFDKSINNDINRIKNFNGNIQNKSMNEIVKQSNITNAIERNNSAKLNLNKNNIPGILKHNVSTKSSKPVQNRKTNPLLNTSEVIIIDDDDDGSINNI